MSVRSEIRKLMWLVHRQFSDTTTIETQQGLLTVSLKDETIGRRLYLKGHYENNHCQNVLRYLRNKALIPGKGDGIILDIGANIGIISIGLLAQGEMAQAIAIEPAPNNVELLRHNIAQNSLEDRCIYLPFAVSNQSGSVRMALSSSNHGDHRIKNVDVEGGRIESDLSGRETVEVATRTLDQLMALEEVKHISSRLSMVWMDVQGHEGYLMEGAKKTFSLPVPVASEIWPYGIRQAGMDLRTFSDRANDYWSVFCVEAGDSFEEFPMDEFHSFLTDLNKSKRYKNIIFLPRL